MINKIILGDCIEELKKLPDNSVDAIITDPPYGLEFMGKDWDKFKQGLNIGGGTTGEGTPFGRSKPLNSVYQYGLEEKNQLQKFCFDWATECLRVLKPGAYLLSFGGTRTYHRMACGIENAGFEIRDCIMWVYGSGFPKSLNIGKQIDKIQGNEREVIGESKWSQPAKSGHHGGLTDNHINFVENKERFIPIETKGSSEWEGWGTALKPAVEPIVVARKPLSEKNVALNVLKWGTGGINIDECRIGTEIHRVNVNDFTNQHGNKFGNNMPIPKIGEREVQGRFPANIILDEEAGEMLDEQSGISKSTNKPRNNKQSVYAESEGRKYGKYNDCVSYGFSDIGGASRFFYCAKASKSERNYGCEELPEQQLRKEDNSAKSLEIFSNQYTESSENPTGRGKTPLHRNNHPTVKPVALMEYLIKLVSRENAIVLDPFLGSGTTAIACLKTNRKFIGIEKEPEYIKIAEARIKPYLEQRKLLLEEKQDDTP